MPWGSSLINGRPSHRPLQMNRDHRSGSARPAPAPQTNGVVSVCQITHDQPPTGAGRTGASCSSSAVLPDLVAESTFSTSEPAASERCAVAFPVRVGGQQLWRSWRWRVVLAEEQWEHMAVGGNWLAGGDRSRGELAANDLICRSANEVLRLKQAVERLWSSGDNSTTQDESKSPG